MSNLDGVKLFVAAFIGSLRHVRSFSINQAAKIVYHFYIYRQH